MADERKVQLGVEVDATHSEEGFGDIKKSAKDMAAAVVQSGAVAGNALDGVGNSGQVAGEKIDRSTKSMIASIQRATAAMEAGGRGTSSYFETLAKQRGVNTDQLRPYLDQLDAAIAKNKDFGLSAGELRNNMRMVPAQFTDIVVSLASGQRPMTVLLQQGGQLKDMFGGVGGAAKALGGYVVGLVNPFTLTAAAVLGLAYAYEKGQEESARFKNSLVASGNYAGMTAGELSTMAAGMTQVSGSQSAAADVITQLVATGKVGGESLETVAKGVASAQRSMGIEAKDAIQMMVQIADDPVKAIQSLDEKYHFLTGSTYEQIRALEEQGDKTGAARLAMETFANTLSGRAPEMQANLGYIEKGWRGIKDAILGAKEALLDIGRDNTPEQRLQAIAQRIDYYGLTAENKKEYFSAAAEVVGKQQAAAASGETAKRNQALVAWKADDDKYLDQTAKVVKDHKDNVAKIKKMAEEAGVSDKELAARMSEENTRYNRALASATSGDRSKALRMDKSALGLGIEQVEAERERLLGIFTTSEKIMEAQKAAGTLSDAEYYQSKRGFLVLESQAREDALQKEIAQYQRQKLTGADALDIQKKIAEAQGKLEKERIDRSASLQVLELQEATAINAKRAALESARQAAQDYLDTTNRGYSRDVQTAWMGSNASTYAKGVTQIEERYQQQRTDLANQRRLAEIQAGGVLPADVQKQYDDRLAIINEFQGKSLESYESYWQALKAGERDWSNGATKAIQDYLDSASNVAALTNTAFTDAFTNMEDALVGFTKTAKLNFSNFFDALLADIARIQIRAAMANLVSAATGSGSGWLGTLLGALAGTATGSVSGLGGGSSSVPGFSSGDLGSGLRLNALGNAFENGWVTAFANGGAFTNTVTDRPTLAPMAMFGEAGPEAVMPLTRDSSGRLGVKASGNGGVSIEQVFYVTKDGVTTQSSNAGNLASMTDAMASAMASIAQSQIVKEMQNGGAIAQVYGGRLNG